jgi:hypothetical protein
MVTPTTLHIGTSTITLEPDIASTLAFINGLQAGHLHYMVYRQKMISTDISVTLLTSMHRHNPRQTVFFNTGFILGWLSTLAQKGTINITQASFQEGYQAGQHTFLTVGNRCMLSASFLCTLVSWTHQGNNSAYNTGYITGFIHALTGKPDTIIPAKNYPSSSSFSEENRVQKTSLKR